MPYHIDGVFFLTLWVYKSADILPICLYCLYDRDEVIRSSYANETASRILRCFHVICIVRLFLFFLSTEKKKQTEMWVSWNYVHVPI